jgi:hypothetical protein
MLAALREIAMGGLLLRAVMGDDTQLSAAYDPRGFGI